MALLCQHQAMPSSPNGPSPAELFLGCKIRLAYEVHEPPSKNTAANVSEECSSSLSPVEDCQPVTMTDGELSCGMGCQSVDPGQSVHSINLAKVRPLFRVGEKVLVRAGPVPKGSSLY